MTRKAHYNVGGISFQVELEENSIFWTTLNSYHLFKVLHSQNTPNFSLSTETWQEDDNLGTLIVCAYDELKKRHESVWEKEGGYVFDYKYNNPKFSYRLYIPENGGHSLISFPKEYNGHRSIDFALNFLYSIFASQNCALIFHASCVIRDGKAVLFHAPCGTGKSTHSQQWMKTFPDTELLNDDGPIVRVWPDGRVIAYGSPWSGQTPCYKNLSAPVAAFVRINRAKENKIHQLSPVETYASLMPSCTGRVKWNPEITEAQHQTLEKIISSIPCYQLDCLPNEDAARICAAEVLK